MYFTPNPLFALMAGMAIVSATWTAALLQASVQEASAPTR